MSTPESRGRGPEIIELVRQDGGGYSTFDGRGVPWSEMPVSVRREACRGLPTCQQRILQDAGLWVDPYNRAGARLIP